MDHNDHLWLDCSKCSSPLCFISEEFSCNLRLEDEADCFQKTLPTQSKILSRSSISLGIFSIFVLLHARGECSCSHQLKFKTSKSLQVFFFFFFLWCSSLSSGYLPAMEYDLWSELSSVFLIICSLNILTALFMQQLTLNYAVLLPWKPPTTYYCQAWQICNSSFSLMSVIRRALLCQTKGLSIWCLVSNCNKWQMLREKGRNRARI